MNAETKFTIKELNAASTANHGQRLAKIVFRAPRDGSEKMVSSQCASIPVLSDHAVRESINELIPAIKEMLEGVQDKIIKDKFLSGAREVTEKEIGISAMLAYLEKESSSSRLTKEEIYQWFDSQVADSLSLAIAAKLGISDDKPEIGLIDRLNNSITAFRDSFAAMAGGRTSFDKAKAKTLINALNIAEAADSLAMRFKARLEKMMTKEEEELMML